MKIKIDKQILWWMKKVKRVGLKDVLLILTPTGVKVSQAEENNSYALEAFLSKKDSSILEYEIAKNDVLLAVPDFSIFTSMIETFKDVIDVKVDNNKVELSSESKTVHYQLLDIEFIKGAGKTPKGKYQHRVEIEKGVLDSVVKDARLLDAIKIKFQVSGGKMSIFVESDNHRTEYHVDVDGGFSKECVLPKHTLEETVTSLSQSKIELGFHDKINSLKIKESTDTFYVVTTLAGVSNVSDSL